MRSSSTRFLISVTLSSNLGDKLKPKVALDASKPNEGYAVYANNGQMAYVCVDDKHRNGSILEKTGDLFCKNNSYQWVKLPQEWNNFRLGNFQTPILSILTRKLDHFETKRVNSTADESDLKFVFVDYRDSANDTELSFSPADDCPANNLLYFTCSDAGLFVVLWEFSQAGIDCVLIQNKCTYCRMRHTNDKKRDWRNRRIKSTSDGRRLALVRSLI